MEIVLIRHTTPDVPKGSSYGFTDVPLKSTFDQEREITLAKIPDPASLIFFSSPLQRCLRLAGFLSPHAAPQTDDRLKELNFGEWEMKRWDGATPGVLAGALQGIIEKPVPGGESYRQLYERNVGFVEELAGRGIERAAIVAHAGVIRSIVAYALDMPLGKIYSIQVGLGSVSGIEMNGGGKKLMYLNR